MLILFLLYVGKAHEVSLMLSNLIQVFNLWWLKMRHQYQRNYAHKIHEYLKRSFQSEKSFWLTLEGRVDEMSTDLIDYQKDFFGDLISKLENNRLQKRNYGIFWSSWIQFKIHSFNNHSSSKWTSSNWTCYNSCSSRISCSCRKLWWIF